MLNVGLCQAPTLCAGLLGDENEMVFCITLRALWLCVYFLNLICCIASWCVCVLVMSLHMWRCCVCKGEKSQQYRGCVFPRSLAIMWMYYVSCQHGSVKQGSLCLCARAAAWSWWPGQWCSWTGVCSYRRYCWPHLDVAFLEWIANVCEELHFPNDMTEASLSPQMTSLKNTIFTFKPSTPKSKTECVWLLLICSNIHFQSLMIWSIQFGGCHSGEKKGFQTWELDGNDFWAIQQEIHWQARGLCLWLGGIWDQCCCCSY